MYTASPWPPTGFYLTSKRFSGELAYNVPFGYFVAMKTKFGAIIVAGSGKINGFVAARNRAGSYLRTKVTPVNPATTFQVNARALLSTLSSSWRLLTPSERTSWNNAVQSFSRTDVFGDIKNPSGFNLYQRLNNNLLTISQAQKSVAPAPTQVEVVSPLTLVADESSSTLVLTLSTDVPAISALKVFATPGQSAGKSFVKSEYRLLTVLDPLATTPVSLGSIFEARLGNIVAGQKIFVKLVAVSIDSGQEVVCGEISTIAVG